MALRPEDLNVGTSPTNAELRAMVAGQEKPTGDYGPPPGFVDPEFEATQDLAKRAIAAQQAAEGPSASELAGRAVQAQADDQARLDRINAFKASDAIKAMSPSEASEVMKYSTALPPDVPMEVIKKNLPEIRRLAGDPNAPFDWYAKVAQSPALAPYIGDPKTASMIASDANALTTLEAATVGRMDFTGSLGHLKIKYTPPAWAEKLNDLADTIPKQLEVGWREVMAAAHLRAALTPEEKAADQAVLAEVERQLNKDYIGQHRSSLAKTMIMGPLMVADALPFLAAGTLGGIAAGGAVVGGIPAAVVGATAMTAAYLLPLKFPQYAKDIKGEEGALGWAAFDSILEATLFTKGFGGQMGLAKRGVESMFPELSRGLTRVTPGWLAGQFLGKASAEAISGAVTMSTASILDKTIRSSAKSLTTGAPLDDQIMMGEGDAFIHNLKGMWLMGLWGAKAHMAEDIHLAIESNRNARFVNSWIDGLSRSELLKTNPKFLEQLIRDMGVKPGEATTLYFNREKFEEHALKNGLDPAKIINQLIGDRGGSYESFVERGARDIEIPLDRASRLAQDKNFIQFFREEGRFTDKAFSLRELREAAEFMRDNLENPQGPKTEGEKAIHEELMERLQHAYEGSMKEGKIDPAEAARLTADLILEHEKAIHVMWDKTSGPVMKLELEQIHDLLFGELGFFSGEFVDDTGTMFSTTRRIWLDKNGKYRPVTLKEIKKGYLTPEGVSQDIKLPHRGYGAGFSSANREIFLNRKMLHSDAGVLTAAVHEVGHAVINLLHYASYKHGGEFTVMADQLARALEYKDSNDRTHNYDQAKEEKFSIWMEEFMHRGKAPTPELVEVFNRMGYWVRQAYTQSPGWGKSPTEHWVKYAKQLTGREFTSDQFMFDSHAAQVLDKFFGAEIALSRFEEQLSRLDARVQEIVKRDMPPGAEPSANTPSSEARQTARERLMDAIARSERKFAKKEKAWFEAAFEDKLKSPDNDRSNDIMEVRFQRLAAWLRDGEMWGPWGEDVAKVLRDTEGNQFKLLDQEMKDLLGPESAARMRKLGLTTKEPTKSIPAGELQALLAHNGLGKGGDVRGWLLELSTQDPIKAYLDKKSTDAVYNQYGYDLLDSPSELHKAALFAAMNEKEVMKRLNLLRHLGQGLAPEKLQRAQITPDQWRRLAAEMMEDRALRQISSERYYNSMIAADSRALKAFEEGSMDRAFDAVQQAVVNHYLFKEARRIEGVVETQFEKISEKVTSESWRSVLGFADPAFRDVTDAILVSLGLAEPQSREWAQKDPKQFVDSLIMHVKDLGMESRMVGWDPATVAALIGKGKAWSEMTPDEAGQIFNALMNIKKLATDIHEYDKGQEKLKLVDLWESAEVAIHQAGIEQVVERKDSSINKSVWVNFFRGLKAVGIALEEPRTWMKYLGKDMFDAVIDSFTEARDRRTSLMKHVLGKYREAYDKLGDDHDLFGVTKGISEALPIKGQAGDVSKNWLVHVMLWMGSESGRAKLLKFTKWTPEQVFEAAGKYLTKKDLTWIQDQHNLSDEVMLPLIRAEHERRYGLPMEEVKAMPYTITLKDGSTVEMGGGYYPVRYDSGRSRIAVLKDLEALDKGGLNDLFPKTSDKYMDSRTGYVDKPDLNWNGYTGHLTRVIHDLSFGEWVHNTSKLFLNNRMNNLMIDRFGESMAKEPKKWLQAVAFDGNVNRVDMPKEIEAAMRWSRGRLAIAALGHNIALFAGDIFNPFAVGAIQSRGFGFNLTATVPAYAKTMASWGQSLANGGVNEHYEWAKATFSEVAHRADTTVDQYREFSGMINEPPSGNITNWRDRIQNTSMFFLKHSDAMVATVVATAKYNDAMSKGATHEEAVKIANRAVASSMPTHSPLEMPSLTRNKYGIGSAIIFYGYWSKLYQMIGDRRAEDVMAGEGKSAMRIAELAGASMAMMMYAEVMGSFFMGHGKDNDEDWGTWYARRMVGSPARLLPLTAAYTQPLIDAAFKGKKPSRPMQSIPYLAPFEQISNLGMKVMDRRATTEDAVWAALEASLFYSGLPSRAWTRSARYGIGLVTGDEQPRGPGDVASGFAFGHSRKYQSETPLTLFDTLTVGGHP